jgi:hypothetical protein
VVERRIARLDDEALAFLRRDRGDELAARAVLRLPDEPRRVAVPDASVVVRVDDGDLSGAGILERGDEAAVTLAERSEELLAVLVAEVVGDVDKEQCVLQRSMRSWTLCPASE